MGRTSASPLPAAVVCGIRTRMKLPMRQFVCMLIAGVAIASIGSGCASNRIRAQLMREKDKLQLENAALERQLKTCREAKQSLSTQVENLQNFPPDRPITLFSPVRIEIASLSGGTDLDGKPGDDGVNVYVRLFDKEGDAVKAPGRLTAQILDLENAGNPRSLCVRTIASEQELCESWYGRFGTNHFKVVCRLDPDGSQPRTDEVGVRVEFVPYLTGVPLSTLGSVPFTRAPR